MSARHVLHGVGAVIIAAISLSIGACGGAAPLVAAPTAKPLEVSWTASADLNPDAAGRPSPVVLRVFVLKDAGTFGAASFDALTSAPAELLAEALLSQARQLVRPAESGAMTLKLDPAATHVGVIAEYRDVVGSQWRAVIAVPPRKRLDLSGSQNWRIDLARSAVRIGVPE